jgi:peptide/nickel transport system permease protein
MASYLLKRVAQAIPIMLLVSMIVFFLTNIMGNPVRLMLPPDAEPEQVQILTHELGLDKPVYVRYAMYVTGLAQGNFGRSYRYNAPALGLVAERLPVTLRLAGFSMLVGILMAIPLGVIAALRRNTWIDLLATTTAVLGRSMPSFWLGLMLMLLVAVQWRLLPVSGVGTWKHLVLPVITLGTGIAASLTRLVRSSLLEVIQSDFIRTARSKGLSERMVVYKHALRNALIPVLTVLGLQLTALIEGSVITETVFALPGMGRLTVQALNQLDFSVVQTAVLLSSGLVITMSLLIDVLYTLVDPRIRYQ